VVPLGNLSRCPFAFPAITRIPDVKYQAVAVNLLSVTQRRGYKSIQTMTNNRITAGNGIVNNSHTNPKEKGHSN